MKSAAHLLVERTTVARGLPFHVEDDVVVARLAALVTPRKSEMPAGSTPRQRRLVLAAKAEIARTESNTEAA